MKHRVITVTAHWLDAMNDNGEKRAWIKGKYFYITSKNYDFSEEDQKKIGSSILFDYLKPEKYRLVGYCQNKYAFKIATLKVDGFSK